MAHAAGRAHDPTGTEARGPAPRAPHQILGIHHVRDDLGGPVGWDIGFLALGAVLIAGGWWLARSGERNASEPPAA